MQVQPLRSTIPSRLDMSLWTPFRTCLILGPGAAWILSGREVTTAGTVSSKLTHAATLGPPTQHAASTSSPIHPIHPAYSPIAAGYVGTVAGYFLSTIPPS